MMMLNSFQTGDFVRGQRCIFDLPDNAGKNFIDSLPEDRFLSI